MLIVFLFTDPLFYFLWIIGVLIAITIHEFAHASMAYKLGDDTAKMSGQMSLNPFDHIHGITWAFILIVGFGWASTYVSREKLKYGKWGDIIVTAAGPLSNLLFAIAIAVLMKVMVGFGLIQTADNLALMFISSFVYINIVLFTFNLLPLYPLDGGLIFMDLFIPDTNVPTRQKFMRTTSMMLTIMILLDLILNVGILSFILGPLRLIIMKWLLMI